MAGRSQSSIARMTRLAFTGPADQGHSRIDEPGCIQQYLYCQSTSGSNSAKSNIYWFICSRVYVYIYITVTLPHQMFQSQTCGLANSQSHWGHMYNAVLQLDWRPDWNWGMMDTGDEN